VRKVSLLHPVAEERAVWSPKGAGLATRQVLDGLAKIPRRRSGPGSSTLSGTASRPSY